MKLGEIEILTPLFLYRADVDFSYLPTLSPIEGALVAAVEKFSGNTENPMSMIPVGALFRNLYGLSGAEMIMGQVVDSLIDRGRLHRINQDSGDSSEISISNLAIGKNTNTGGINREEQRGGTERPKQSLVLKRIFDPITQKIFKELPITICKKDIDSRFRVPSKPFEQSPDKVWISLAVREELEQETEILSSKLDIESTYWLPVTAEIHIVNGELSLKTGIASVDSYLAGLSPDTSQTWFREESISLTKQQCDQLPEGCFYPPRIPDSASGLVVTSGMSHEYLKDLSSSTDIVHLNIVASDDETIGLGAVNDGGQGVPSIEYRCSINNTVGMVFWHDSGIRVLSLACKWNRSDLEILVAHNTESYLRSSFLSDIFDVLQDEAAVSTIPLVSILPAYWLSPSVFWDFIIANLSDSIDVQEKLVYLDTVIVGLNNSRGQLWDSMKRSLSRDTLARVVEPMFLQLDIASVSRLIDSLNRLQEWLGSDLDIQNLPPNARTVGESNALRNVYLQHNVDFGYPSSVYDFHIIGELLQNFPVLDWLAESEPANEFEKLLTDLATTYALFSSSSEKPESVYDESAKDRQWQDLTRLYSRLESFYPSASKALPKLQNLFSENISSEQNRPTENRDVIAFDTNVLVRQGDIVGSLHKNDFLVFPRIVMHEVEKLKKPRNKNSSKEIQEAEGFRINGRKALRLIQKLPLDSLVVPSGNFDLLLPDEPRNNDKERNDSEIMACLIPYVENSRSVTLVTDDEGLPLQCRAYGIRTMKSDSFLEHQQEKRERTEK